VANRAAMVEVQQNLQTVRHKLMGFFALDVDNKANAARVVLELWVIKSLFHRRARRRLLIGGLHYVLVVTRRISLRSLIFYSLIRFAQ
jgi:hypothetical protein